jgi:glycosyltransferase involved in cell wall biosynthesis
MINKQKKILVVGLFLSEKNKNKILRTAADQLAELLSKNSYRLITVSNITNSFGRFVDTITTVITTSSQYKIAILPLYGGFKSYIWQSVTTGILKLLRKKVILIVHGGSIPARMKSDPSKYLRSFKKADVVIGPSAFITSTLKQYNIQSELVENVVNLDEYIFHKKETFRPRLLWMRTLEDIYNPEMAIRVAAILSRKYVDLQLVMAGYDKGSMTMVKQLATDLNVYDKIEFPGYINNDQKNKYANDLDIYICTNRIDNAPVSFIEMMAMGLPVVSVNTGGIPYLLQEKVNGLMVDLDDDDAMANKISSIIEQPELGKRLAMNGQQFAQQFGEKPVLAKWQNIFERLSHN